MKLLNYLRNCPWDSLWLTTSTHQDTTLMKATSSTKTKSGRSESLVSAGWSSTFGNLTLKQLKAVWKTISQFKLARHRKTFASTALSHCVGWRSEIDGECRCGFIRIKQLHRKASMGHSVSVNGLEVQMIHLVTATWYAAAGDSDLLKMMKQLNHVSGHLRYTHPTVAADRICS